LQFLGEKGAPPQFELLETLFFDILYFLSLARVAVTPRSSVGPPFTSHRLHRVAAQQ